MIHASGQTQTQCKVTSVVCNETFDRRGLVGFGYASCCDKMNHASRESQSDTQAMKMDLNKSQFPSKEMSKPYHLNHEGVQET